MKLGINTYTYMWSIGFAGAAPENPLSAIGLLEKARALGVKVVQVGPNLLLEKLPNKELDRFIELSRAWGIELELGTRGLETEHLEQQAALCKRMGSRLLRTIPEIGGQTPPLSEIPDYLRKLNPTLVRDGIRLAMENGKIQAEDLLKILEQVGSPQVGIVLDMVNSLAVPEGWKAVTRLLAPYVMCLHYKDFIVKRAWHMMGLLCEGRPAGQGLVDAAWLFNALQASHYDFNVILELWPPEQPMLEDTIALEDQWAKESIPFLRRFVQE